MTDRKIMKQALEALELAVKLMPDVGGGKRSNAIAALRAAIEQSSPLPPPPECQTEAEKIAYAFGWYKALEKHPRYYTIITTGEYDNLEIVGLYVSDHPVDPTEWRTAFKQFNQELQDEHEAIYQRHGGKLGYGHIPKAHEECIAYMHKIHPLQPFIEKHGMKQLMFTELWTWGQP